MSESTLLPAATSATIVSTADSWPFCKRCRFHRPNSDFSRDGEIFLMCNPCWNRLYKDKPQAPESGWRRKQGGQPQPVEPKPGHGDTATGVPARLPGELPSMANAADSLARLSLTPPGDIPRPDVPPPSSHAETPGKPPKTLQPRRARPYRIRIKDCSQCAERKPRGKFRRNGLDHPECNQCANQGIKHCKEPRQRHQDKKPKLKESGKDTQMGMAKNSHRGTIKTQESDLHEEKILAEGGHLAPVASQTPIKSTPARQPPSALQDSARLQAQARRRERVKIRKQQREAEPEKLYNCTYCLEMRPRIEFTRQDKGQEHWMVGSCNECHQRRMRGQIVVIPSRSPTPALQPISAGPTATFAETARQPVASITVRPFAEPPRYLPHPRYPKQLLLPTEGLGSPLKPDIASQQAHRYVARLNTAVLPIDYSGVFEPQRNIKTRRASIQVNALNTAAKISKTQGQPVARRPTLPSNILQSSGQNLQQPRILRQQPVLHRPGASLETVGSFQQSQNPPSVQRHQMIPPQQRAPQRPVMQQRSGQVPFAGIHPRVRIKLLRTELMRLWRKSEDGRVALVYPSWWNEEEWAPDYDELEGAPWHARTYTLEAWEEMLKPKIDRLEDLIQDVRYGRYGDLPGEVMGKTPPYFSIKRMHKFYALEQGTLTTQSSKHKCQLFEREDCFSAR
ncbi:hypothetical protein BU16DRAFT_542974 [Lophium mytilinum]|uniref:Uncharacterized protein n=1 Tax=Lophium mytilinum TaxID=390894 RepID=A0A6A6QII0_9PEZI|nr:hypothetical protein BU16DRAFT_542974 [Lophium mytilinum]